MRRIIAAAGLCALGVASAWADTSKPAPAPKAQPEPIVKLVEKLGGRDYKTREAAARALETRGVEALPELRKALADTSSAEVRRRLSTMVQALERVQLLSPKRVTLHLKDRPVADVIKELSRQTGYAMQFQGGNNNIPITVEKDNASFWEVMDHVAAVGGLQMYHNENQGIMLYANSGQVWPHVAYHGPFKVVAQSFNYNKSVNLGPIQANGVNQTRSESLSFTFNVHSEPKLPMLGMGQPRLIDAVDDLGNSMKPAGNGHETYYGPSYQSYRSFQYSSSVALSWPNKEARKVKHLRAALPITLLAEQKPDIIVDDILKLKEKKFTGNNVEMTVDEVKEQNNKTQYHIKLSVRNSAANAANDYNWTNSVHQRIELLDAKGNKYYPQGYNWINSSPGHIQATFMFGNNGNAVGPPARLVYNHWNLLQHSVEFEFKDLQLP